MIFSPESKSSHIKMAAGKHTTVAAVDEVVTGLKVVSHVVVSFETDPADANILVSALPSATTPGSITIKTWKTDGADPTPVAATAFSKAVHWMAMGR